MTKLATKGGVVKTKHADGRISHWDAQDAVAFWRAKDYSGTGSLKNLARDDDLHDLAINGATFLPFDDEKYVYFPGTSSGSNFINTPDGPDLDITGDLDIRVLDVVSPNWLGTRRSFVSKAPGGGSDSFVFAVNTTGALELYLTETGSALTAVTVPGELVNGQKENGLRVTYRQSDKRVQFFKLLAGVWTQIGTNQTHPAASIFSGTGNLEIGGRIAAPTQTFLGNIGRVEIRSDIDGPIVASWSAEDMSQTGGVSGGRTWTITRATSGLKNVLVDRPLFLFGTDDYMEAPDHADLDFGSGQAFTVILVQRSHGGAPAAYMAVISKRNGPDVDNVGWEIAFDVTLGRGRIVYDSSATAAANLYATSGARDGIAKIMAASRTWLTMKGYFYGEFLSGVGPADSLSSSEPLRIARRASSAGAAYADMEFLGAAIFRRALSDAEILEVGQTLGAD